MYDRGIGYQPNELIIKDNGIACIRPVYLESMPGFWDMQIKEPYQIRRKKISLNFNK